jgi:bacteriorhodopsin
MRRTWRGPRLAREWPAHRRATVPHPSPVPRSIVAITALAYLIQALNGSISAILGPNSYELQWLRYAQWALNTPMVRTSLPMACL